MSLPAARFTHLQHLTDVGGLFEHALLTTPRPEHGYCVDDVARGLVVLSREPDLDPELVALSRQYLEFVLLAQAADGRFRNRRAVDLSWSGAPSVEDCWGRALWGLGAVVAGAAPAPDRDAALQAFERGAAWWSPWSRAMSFAALGAASVVEVHPRHRGAREMLAEAAGVLKRPSTPEWPWPEPRLTYANAVVPDVLLAAGSALGDSAMVSEGLALLAWLLQVQLHDGHLSVVPVGGWGPGDTGPAFDQQPIEASTLADACARAHAITGEDRWLDGLTHAAAWFFGANDAGVSLYDADSGGGCDGLESSGRNENQGAESTLALLATLQQARLLRGRGA